MAEQRTDPLESEVRQAFERLHAEIEVPQFEAVWQAAHASMTYTSKRGFRRQRRRRGWLTFMQPSWAAAAVLIGVGAALTMRLIPSPSEETSELFPPTTGMPADQAVPVMWYAPTDELLEVTSLRYAARPAALTTYDPIRLEVRP